MARPMTMPLCACALAVSIAAGGCGDSSEAPTAAPPAPNAGAAAPAPTAAASDPDDVAITEGDVKRPADFADAVSRIKGYRDSIRDSIAAGMPTKAHRALDELDVVLEWLPAIARDGGVPKERWEELNVASRRVQELFNKVHSNIDDKKAPDYAGVSKDVDEAIGRLEGVASTPATKG